MVRSAGTEDGAAAEPDGPRLEAQSAGPGPAPDLGSALERVRALCLRLPRAEERLSHGEPTWFVGKKVFVMFDNNHHDAGRVAIWCNAPPGAQAALTAHGGDGGRFFVPPYVGYRGWVGVRLDLPETDWDVVTDVVEDAYRMSAPPRLLSLLG